jgi:peptidoglycan-N-acetylglucosamine deacetylase
MIVSSLKGMISLSKFLINEVSTSEKLVAMTFDDGPNPIYTPQVLDIFLEVKGKATFFMLGEQMERYPEVLGRVMDEGHEIGNHTYTHPKLSHLNREQCEEEMKRNEKIIVDLSGKKPVVFRPPYLDYSEETVSIVQQKGYAMIGAVNLEARDWEHPGVGHIVEKSIESVKNGSILLFHDGFGDRSQTIEAVRILVTELTSQGFLLVTVSELLKSSLLDDRAL